MHWEGWRRANRQDCRIVESLQVFCRCSGLKFYLPGVEIEGGWYSGNVPVKLQTHTGNHKSKTFPVGFWL